MATEAFNEDFRGILEGLNAEGLNAGARSGDELEQALRVFLAAKLFETARVSLGRAAKMDGLPKVVFTDELGQLGISWINLDDEELEREFENA